MGVGSAAGNGNQQGGAYGGGGVQGGYGSGGGQHGGGGANSGGALGGGQGGGGQSVSSAVGLGMGTTTAWGQGASADASAAGVNGFGNTGDGGYSRGVASDGKTLSTAGILGLANQSKSMIGSDVSKSALSYDRGYSFSDVANNFGALDASLGQLGGLAGGLVNTALGFVPGYGLVSSVTDAAQKAAREGFNSLGFGDVAKVAVSAVPGSPLIKAGVMTAAQLADGNTKGAASTVGGTMGSLMGQNIGYSVGGQLGAIAGGLIGGLGGSALANSGTGDSKSSSSGTQTQGVSRGSGSSTRVTDSVYGSAPKVQAPASVAKYMDYSIPQPQLINPMEFL